MAILAANLVRQFPDVGFCLHAHDDKGLGLQNALASIYYGFDHIEAAFSGFGNRSGLAAIEVINEIFGEKNITIKGISLNRQKLIETGRDVERTFFAVPNVYRPVSGQIVNWENLGVANIPDYLGAERNAKRFLNDVGLHPRTVEALIRDGSNSLPPERLATFIPEVTEELRADLASRYERKRTEFDTILAGIETLYTRDVVFEEDARNFVAARLVESISV
jgi:2-isopropylmalate synthase